MNLIVIEGLDGAGKSTQIKLLKSYFEEKGIESEYLHFPRTDAPYFGELVSRFLRGEFGRLDEVDPYLVAMLYAGDRKDASEMIKEWLKKGKYVILDRYVYSNIAYQCAKISDHAERSGLRDWILDLEFRHFAIPQAAINIFLDVPFAFTSEKLIESRSGSDRIYLKGNTDIHEDSLDFQRSVREVYLETAKSDVSLQILDCAAENGAMLTAEQIFDKTLDLLVKKGII
ncbi:MAG: dTMP kinase [Marinilabiliaceae bacterium]|jgi:dTMP kinase|nr:dTMP kinase [Marinilabiliaceae bacterium]